RPTGIAVELEAVPNFIDVGADDASDHLAIDTAADAGGAGNYVRRMRVPISDPACAPVAQAEACAAMVPGADGAHTDASGRALSASPSPARPAQAEAAVAHRLADHAALEAAEHVLGIIAESVVLAEDRADAGFAAVRQDADDAEMLQLGHRSRKRDRGCRLVG